MADVSVVIGNYEGAALLPDCLESLAAQDRAPAEVLVVDAGSRDDSVAVAERLGATVLRAENRGLGYLYNLGARAARTEYVLVANNDLAFDRRCVGLLADALDEDERRFAADPCQLDWSGERVIHARTVLSRGPLLRQPLPGLRIDPLVPAEDTVLTLTANAGAMLVRRELLLELGGFDETFFIDFEDLDLCWRAWLRGWESVYVPAARLRHRVGMSATATVSPRRLRSSHHNLVRFALKCLPPRQALGVVAGELLRLAAHPRPVAGALAQVVRELPGILAERRRLAPSRPLFDWLAGGQAGPRA
ncbi:MAG TPA: glycosyltransferase family 2 protein [Gaiellaceae bacterium]|nr:glycosyltransferase family 2 protein [Gaiellaceae bacterium]